MQERWASLRVSRAIRLKWLARTIPGARKATMHFHLDFSASNILWILSFAAELVLLVVLLGRDRARRFRWFTLYIALLALLLLINKLVLGRMAPVASAAIYLTVSDATVLVGLVVIAGLAKQAFGGAPRKPLALGALLVLGIALAALALWGPWPAWKTFTTGSVLATLRGMQMFAEKGTMLIAMLAIEVTVAVLLFGRRFDAGWRSHVQQILIGLSLAGMSQLAVRALWQRIAAHAVVHSLSEYERLLGVRARIFDANNMVFLCALVWWIAWLWLEEPATAKTAEGSGGADSGGADA